MSRPTERGDAARIFVASCRFGRGVFAAETIPASMTILTFTGPLLTLAQAVALGDKQVNALQLGPDVFLNTEEPGVIVNHSCHPNAGILNDLDLVALRTIERGVEITMDYSTTVGGNDDWEMECLCGEPACQGRVGPSSPCRQRCERATSPLVSSSGSSGRRCIWPDDPVPRRLP